MAGYVTQQRNVLHDFFQNHLDKQYTVRELVNELSSQDISLSAVYRNLGTLEKDGFIRRKIKEGSRECVYQYIASDECKCHIHVECQCCGESYHLEDDIAKAMKDALLNSSGFDVEVSKTVLYGNCKKCVEKK